MCARKVSSPEKKDCFHQPGGHDGKTKTSVIIQGLRGSHFSNKSFATLHCARKLCLV